MELVWLRRGGAGIGSFSFGERETCENNQGRLEQLQGAATEACGIDSMRDVNPHGLQDEADQSVGADEEDYVKSR